MALNLFCLIIMLLVVKVLIVVIGRVAFKNTNKIQVWVHRFHKVFMFFVAVIRRVGFILRWTVIILIVLVVLQTEEVFFVICDALS